MLLWLKACMSQMKMSQTWETFQFNLWEPLVILLSISFELKSKKKKNTCKQKKPAFKNICRLSLAGRRAQTQNLYNCEKNEKKTMLCVFKGLFFVSKECYHSSGQSSVKWRWVRGGNKSNQSMTHVSSDCFPGEQTDSRGCSQAQRVNALQAHVDATCILHLRVCGHHMWKVKRGKRVCGSALIHRSSRIQDLKTAWSSHFKSHWHQFQKMCFSSEDGTFIISTLQIIIFCFSFW